MPLFCFQQKNVKVANKMKQNKTIWGSVGLLTGVVVAILALVRGAWLLPLLIATFAVWGLWLIFALVSPRWRRKNSLRRLTARWPRPCSTTSTTGCLPA